MKIVPGAIASKKALPTRCLVWAVDARWTLTASAAAASSAGEAAKPTPACSAAAAVRLRDQATTFISKPSARWATALPMAPKPRIPRVRPARPRALPNSFFCHEPLRSATVASTSRRSAAISSPTASSATAAVFLPGQLAT